MISERVRRVAESRPLADLSTAISRRAVTIYLWHPAAVVLSYAAVGDTVPSRAVLVLGLTVLLTAIPVLLFGIAEDIAASRRPIWHGSLQQVAAVIALPAAAAAVAAALPMLAEPAVAPADPQRRTGAPPGPPSYRVPLGRSAFVAVDRLDTSRPIRLRDDRVPARQIRRAMGRWLRAHPEMEGLGVAIVTGEHSWSGQVGESRASPNERYAIRSLTKLFTTALVLRAADQGLLDLDLPVPAVRGVGLPPAAPTITPRQLLQHTSGLADYPTAKGYDSDSADYATTRGVTVCPHAAPRLAGQCRPLRELELSLPRLSPRACHRSFL